MIPMYLDNWFNQNMASVKLSLRNNKLPDSKYWEVFKKYYNDLGVSPPTIDSLREVQSKNISFKDLHEELISKKKPAYIKKRSVAPNANISHKVETLKNIRETDPKALTGTVGNKSYKIIKSNKEKDRRKRLLEAEVNNRSKSTKSQINKSEITNDIVKEKSATKRSREKLNKQRKTNNILEKNKDVVKSKSIPSKSNKKVSDVVNNSKNNVKEIINRENTRKLARKAWSSSKAIYESGKGRLMSSFTKHPRLWKFGTLAAGSMVMIGAFRSAFNNRFINRNNQVIPEHYDRGYDIMNEYLTDFGSPVKLCKAASKTITPYYSSVRRGLKTSVESIRNRNISLAMHDKAIQHMRY